MTRLPEQRLADELVVARGLEPPIDISGLLAEHADIIRTHELHDCDAVVAGLSDVGRPQVIVNTNKPESRQRFSMAHELAHILIPWHSGSIACAPEEGTPDTQDIDVLPRAGGAEAEADRFAAALLVPSNFLSELENDPGTAIASLEATKVSASAALRALASHREPGLVLVILDSSGLVREVHRSPRTPGVGFERGHPVDRSLAKRADSRGKALYQRTNVFWYWFHGGPVQEPTRPWTDVLPELLSRHGLAGARPRIEGIVGSANGSGAFETPTELAHHLRRKMRMDDELFPLTEDSAFAEYASSRAWAVFGLG